MTLLLVRAFFEIEERGQSTDRDLVHPTQPLASIHHFQREGATTT